MATVAAAPQQQLSPNPSPEGAPSTSNGASQPTSGAISPTASPSHLGGGALQTVPSDAVQLPTVYNGAPSAHPVPPGQAQQQPQPSQGPGLPRAPQAAGTPDNVATTGMPAVSVGTPVLRPAAFAMPLPSAPGCATPDGRHTPLSFVGSINHAAGSHPMTPIGPADSQMNIIAPFQPSGVGTPYRAPSPSNMSVNSGVAPLHYPHHPQHQVSPQHQQHQHQTRGPAGSCNLIVSDLPRTCKHGTLRKHCERFGAVVSINVKMESRPRPSAKGFVLFGDAGSAARARAELHQSLLDGHRISAFPANQARGAVPCATLFVRFIPSGIDSAALHGFFNSFMPLRTARVRAQKAPNDHAAPQHPEFQEAVVDFFNVVPEHVREAIADTDAVTDYQTGAVYRLDTPLVVKYDEPESIRVSRNGESGQRSGHNSGAGSPQQFGGGAPQLMHQQQQPAPGTVSVPLDLWLPHNVNNGLVVLPPGASFVSVNGVDCVNLPHAAAQQFLATHFPQAAQPQQPSVYVGGGPQANQQRPQQHQQHQQPQLQVQHQGGLLPAPTMAPPHHHASGYHGQHGQQQPPQQGAPAYGSQPVHLQNTGGLPVWMTQQ